MSTYNGWTNRQTWIVNLWLSNDEWLHNHVVELADAAKDRQELARSIKDFIYEITTEGTSGLTNDMIEWFLAMVNWDEIAEAWKE